MQVMISDLFGLSHYYLRRENSSVFEKFDSNLCCPICDGLALQRISSIETRSSGNNKLDLGLMQCESCGHAFYSRTPSQNDLDEFYASNWHVELNANKKLVVPKPNASPWSAIHHLLALNLSLDSRILDFGCGFGDGIATLETHGFEYLYGVEPGRSRYEVASAKYGDKIACGSTEVLSSMVEKYGKFDLIYSNHVAEHLLNPREVIPELKKHLTENGKLVISVPSIGSESFIHCALYYPHLHLYTPESIAVLMSQVGMHGYVWDTAGPQLAVVGTVAEDLNSSFSKIENEKQSNLHEIKRVVLDELSNIKPNKTTAVSFQHPWSAKKVSRTGLKVHSRFATFCLVIVNSFLRSLVWLFPLKLKTVFIKIIRSLFYRTVAKFSSVTTVDILFLRVCKPEEQEVNFIAENEIILLDK